MLALGARFPSWPKLVTQLNTSLEQGRIGRLELQPRHRALARRRGVGRRDGRHRRRRVGRRQRAVRRLRAEQGRQPARGCADSRRRDRQGHALRGLRHVHEQGREDVRGGARRRAARLQQRDGAAPGRSTCAAARATSSPTRRTSRTRWRPCPRTTARSATSTARSSQTLSQLATSQASSARRAGRRHLAAGARPVLLAAQGRALARLRRDAGGSGRALPLRRAALGGCTRHRDGRQGVHPHARVERLGRLLRLHRLPEPRPDARDGAHEPRHEPGGAAEDLHAAADGDRDLVRRRPRAAALGRARDHRRPRPAGLGAPCS